MNKTSFSIRTFTAFAAVLFFTSHPGAEVSEFSNDWESFIVNDQYRIVNNVWNKDARTGDYTQSIIKGDDFFGWKWNWKGDKNVVLSYPEVMNGDSPWNEDPNLNPEFPFQAGSKKLTVDFDIELQTKGK